MAKERAKKSESMTNQQDFRQEWLLKAYEECWKQYCHEDNLGHSRNTVFLGVQTALSAIATGSAVALLRLMPDGSIVSPNLYFLLGIILVVLSIIGLFSAIAWKQVTEAAQAYIDIRWFTASVIEAEGQLGELGLTIIEREWLEWSRAKSPKSPFRENPNVKPLKGIEGWTAARRIVNCFLILWCLALVSGGLLLTLNFNGVTTFPLIIGH